VYSILSPNKKAWLQEEAIILDISVVNGVYHLYYSVSTFGSQDSAIGLPTSTSMGLNIWTDYGSISIQSSSSKLYNIINSNLFNNGEKYYMNFSSFWYDIY
jgi:arabinan endo-1,5-alpha-L-arabinosidase